MPLNTHVIYAGGTFGCHGTPLSALPASQFLPSFLIHYPQLIAIDNDLIKDSSTFTPHDFIAIYELICKAYTKGATQFILITGTDTLAYLAGFLYYALAGKALSLVITGSMLPFFDPTASELTPNTYSDAPINFAEALNFLQQKRHGVFVSFSRHIYHANSVQKLHTSERNAFTGELVRGQESSAIRQALPNTHSPTLSRDFAIHSLYCLPANAGVLVHALQTLFNSPPTAVIIIGFGAGNTPYSVALEQCFSQLSAQGFLLIMTSACPFGSVSQDYAAGAWQYKAGAVSGGALTISALYGKALWLCATLPVHLRRQYWEVL